MRCFFTSCPEYLLELEGKRGWALGLVFILIMLPYLDRNLAIEAPFEIFRGLPLLYSIILNENLIVNNIGCVRQGIPFSYVHLIDLLFPRLISLKHALSSVGVS